MVKWKKIKNQASNLISKGQDASDTIDTYTDIDLNSSDVTPGLTPIGDSGWYSTPNDPADPTDCDRYPDSPYCGGNPFTKTPIGLEPEIIINQCDIGFKSSPVLGFVKLPPVHLVYRKEECRKLPDPPPFEPPDNDYNSPVPLPPTPCSLFNDPSVVITIGSTYSVEQWESEDSGTGFAEYTSTLEVQEFIYPYKGERKVFRDLLINNNFQRVEVPVTCVIKIKETTVFNYNDVYNQLIWKGSLPATGNETTKVEGEILLTGYELASPSFGYNSYLFHVYYHENTKAQNAIASLRNFRENLTSFNHKGVIGFKTRERQYKILIKCNKDNDYNPPPPPPGKRKCCMSCCPPNSQTNNDQLLKLLLQKVNKLSEIVGVDAYPGKLTKTRVGQDGKPQAQDIDINTLSELVGQVYLDVEKASKAIGIDDYPVTVPKSLITRHQSFTDKTLDVLSNLIPGDDDNDVTTTEVPSLTQLLAWYIERFDEIMGQFEIPVEIKDSDPTTPGDQTKGFKLPNIAESIGEMFGLLLQIAINSETLVNMNTRLAISTTQDMQQNFKTYAMANAIAEWLGFKYKEETQKMPVMFDIGKESIDELLKEKEIDVSVVDFDDKQNFHDTLLKLSEAAAIIKAIHFRKLDAKQDIAKQIKDIIKGYNSNKNNVNGSEDNFDEFIREAEVGFTGTPGITDPTNPYGRDFSQRPKIRKLDNTSDIND